MFLLFLTSMGSLLHARDLEISLFPVMSYSHETSFMGGAFVNVLSKEKNERNRNLWDVSSIFMYTAKNQFQTVIDPVLVFQEGRLSLKSELRGRYWPDTFHGIGNNTPAGNAEDYTIKYVQFQIEPQWLLWKNLAAAPVFYVKTEKVLDCEPNGSLDTRLIRGSESGSYWGTGASLTWDTSDSRYYPEKGVNYTFEVIHYEKWLHQDESTAPFHRVETNLLHYLSPQPGWVMAFQTNFVASGERTPFTFLPELGNRLRAFDSKRYVDRSVVAQRMEQRFIPVEMNHIKDLSLFQNPLLRRCGFVVFTELGQVAPVPESMKWNRNHWSAGAGLRFMILPQEKLNIRLDYGFSDHTTNIIIQGREAF